MKTQTCIRTRFYVSIHDFLWETHLYCAEDQCSSWWTFAWQQACVLEHMPARCSSSNVSMKTRYQAGKIWRKQAPLCGTEVLCTIVALIHTEYYMPGRGGWCLIASTESFVKKNCWHLSKDGVAWFHEQVLLLNVFFSYLQKEVLPNLSFYN